MKLEMTDGRTSDENEIMKAKKILGGHRAWMKNSINDESIRIGDLIDGIGRRSRKRRYNSVNSISVSIV